MKYVIDLNQEQEDCLTRKFGSPDNIFKKVVTDCVSECRREDILARTEQPEQARAEEVEIIKDEFNVLSGLNLI